MTPRQSTCDDANTGGDKDFIDAIRRSLDGLETLALEQNEFKWAEFFARRMRQQPVCLLGISSLFLVAADVTAFAAAASGGEHQMRVRRALLFAQGLALQHVEQGPSASQGARALDLLRTRWPLWQLLRSVRKEMASGSRFALPAPRRAALPETALELPEEDIYLTVIVQCRNDDYGGNMLLRLNRMLATTATMLHSAQVPAEIIVVEWNPPLHEPHMREAITREPGGESVPIRVIHVPTSIHMSMPHHKAHPIFEHTAENIAFRRARGQFILKTNIDNILSPFTVMFIARRELQPDVVYRAAYMEYDVTCPETEGMTANELLDWLFSREDLVNNMNLELADLREKYPDDAMVCMESGQDVAQGEFEHRPFYWPGSGDFVLTSRRWVLAVHGYPEVAQNWQTDDLIHCRLRAAGVRQVVLQPPCVTVHQNHRRINRVRASTRWVITDHNFKEVCANPFRPMQTEIGLDDKWGFADYAFDEFVL
ncbi:unnamed protein product [Symbiodinium necroappetens]|uniref:Uncharacterized protein n=1 Tax=Symbiodinium necroappetens TaxID=1628268 RepID=A0A812PC82_9DINO|nr:unnamed protein product [Symbiodinium necroappetens]